MDLEMAKSIMATGLTHGSILSKTAAGGGSGRTETDRRHAY
jgi:hypothetical protein